MTLLARDPRAPFALTPSLMPSGRRARGYDWVLVAAALALALIGATLVWAATRDTSRAAGADPQGFLYRHLFNIAIAAVLMVAAARLDARLLRLFGPLVYVASLLGLLAVFAVGTTVNGAHAWIRLGAGFQLQPSEFMKLGMIVGMAVLFSQRAGERRSRSENGIERRSRSDHGMGGNEDAPPSTGDVLLALILVAVPLALVMLQPDLGSAMVLGAAAFGVLVAAGVRARWTLGLLVLAVLVAVLAVKAGLLADYQLKRFTSFTHPGRDVQGAAYNVTQAHIAIANGGLFGTGLFRGPQTSGGFVPEQQTDFVFSVAGEEFGLVGGGIVIALFAVVCWRGLRIARAADPAGRLVAVGVVCWIAFQAFQNIGMNLGLTPVTGLPLPFVSYGGSSMFAQGLAIGLIQAVRRRSLAE
ncbi:MAG: rod shape determining protein RodA [Pseudonocardiales bacterium]|nr:rod shape determining protein RodA [Pseudonocardiales bacterium]